MESLEEKNPENYKNIINFLNLSDVSKPNTAKTIEKTRKIMLKTRKERNVLIKTIFGGDFSRKPPFFLL